ncbi:MAG TPA: GxxExxY protein, partial [Candidatus Binataceae bacterium]|nr:GxxExxY protein [Candidatus Binataceae bacterium]
REVAIPIFYRSRQLSVSYRCDFVCYDAVVVELKALSHMSGAEESQMINYLKATRHEVGLLLNFGTPSLEYRRFVFSKSAQSA